GSLFDKDHSIYIWGDGTTRTSLKGAQVTKIDSSGNKIWSTEQSALLNEGFITRAYADSNSIYAFGIGSTFFYCRIDKATGYVFYKKSTTDINNYGLIDFRDKGTDSLRVVCYSTTSTSPPYTTPIKTISISKINGNAAPPLPYGIPTLAPLYIDNNDIAYYYTATDSLVKYDVANGNILWRNKTWLEGAYYSRPPTNIGIIDNKIYLFGDRWARQVDENTGLTGWNKRMNVWMNDEFYPSDIVFKQDTIYVVSTNPYYGGYDIYNHLSKFSKIDGSPYIDGTIADTGAIDYYARGWFKGSKILVDSAANMHIFGHYVNDQTGQRAVKKFSWYGSLLAEKKLSVDSMINGKDNNLVPGRGPGYVTGALLNNEPFFIYTRYIQNDADASGRICYTALSNDLSVKTEKYFDNNAYQYPSTVTDIETAGIYTYVLKKQGFAVYVEKLFSADSLVWRLKLSDSCYFTPANLAVDSTGRIGVIGHSVNCRFNNDEISMTSKLPISRIVYIHPDGYILANIAMSPYFTTNKHYNLVGAENGFYVVSESAIAHPSPELPYEQTGIPAVSNFSSGFNNAQSNKIFLTINTADSLYIFSSRLTNTTDAFYTAVDKATLESGRKSMLTAHFPLGYLAHAVKCLQDSNYAYVSGLTGQGGKATIIKMNPRTGAVVWKYSSTIGGEAFKLSEDDAGYVYAFIKGTDTTRFVKLDPANGSLVWQYSKIEPDRFSRAIDMDINNHSKTLVAAGFNYVGALYKPYVISLNSQTGQLKDLQVIQGNPLEPTLVHAVETMHDSTVVIGGNLNIETLQGKFGYLLYKGNQVSCDYNYWTGSMSNLWENPGNWSCGVVPGPVSNVVIQGGNVILGSNAVVNTFVLAPGASFTITTGFNLTVLH
ncbi:MAG: hypothetical protein EOP46_16725, partial [Sphingobacteriaceae bacterium]